MLDLRKDNWSRMRTPILASIIICNLIVTSCYAIDNNHFYRASNFFYAYHEPRFEYPGLTSLDFTLGTGSSRKAQSDCDSPCWNNCDSVGILQLYGTHNIHAAAQSAPNLNPNNPVDASLIALANVTSCDPCFGNLAFTGKFNITEANILITQNLVRGCFFQFHIPVRRIAVTGICPCDLTPVNSCCTSADLITWKRVLNIFPEVMTRFDLNVCDFKEVGIGDTSFLAGWTRTFNDTEVLDFVDTTIRAGLLVPTAKKQDANNPFAIPLGYNGHFAIPISVDFSFGLCEWMTFGFHMGAMSFFKTDRCIRSKTNEHQTGLILFTKEDVRIDRGPLWDFVGYFKADHIAKGLSFLLGYTYARQEPSSVAPACCDVTFENCPPARCVDDCRFPGWHMHTLHILAEYDFAKPECSWAPRLGIFYNHVLGGENIFDTSVGGMTAGLDIGWAF